MNETFGPFLPQQATEKLIIEPIPSRPEAPAINWAKRLLACNPFYIGSAALLLFGLYRVSAEPKFLGEESAHLFFNYAALHIYQLVLVFTAIFLARRRIWYDSTLLVGLENLLLLVPFILVSQAGLIQESWVWVLCLGGGFIALSRFGSLKHFIPSLNAPFRLTGIAVMMLLVNVALPIVYRVLHQSKVGTRPDWGSAYYTNEFAWLLVLPVLCLLLGYVPFAASGDKLPQHKTIPLGLYSLWLVGTAVHLYSLGYVYDFALRLDLLAPGLWTLCWVTFLRAHEFFPRSSVRTKQVLCFTALLVPLLAWQRTGTILTLVGLNALAYGLIQLRRNGARLALHCLLLSIATALVSLPQTWTVTLFPHLAQQNAIGTGIVFYGLFAALLSRNLKAGLFGAFVLGMALSAASNNSDALNLGFQGGLVFVLLHSLRWEDAQHPGAVTLRALVCVGWVTHTILWEQFGQPGFTPCLLASLVLVGFLMKGFLQRTWQLAWLPLSAVVVMLVEPGRFSVTKVQAAPTGLLAVVGSFVLLAAGTGAALIKQRSRQSQDSEPNTTES